MYNDLGPAPADKSLREWVDSKVAEFKAKTKHVRQLNKPLLKDCKEHRAKMSKVASERVELYA